MPAHRETLSSVPALHFPPTILRLYPAVSPAVSPQVETPPGPDKAFEAHAVLVACPAPRRRASVLVRINGSP
jgi:hypothetical protein